MVRAPGIQISVGFLQFATFVRFNQIAGLTEFYLVSNHRGLGHVSPDYTMMMVMVMKRRVMVARVDNASVVVLALTAEVLIAAHNTSSKKTKLFLGEVLHTPTNCNERETENTECCYHYALKRKKAPH